MRTRKAAAAAATRKAAAAAAATRTAVAAAAATRTRWIGVQQKCVRRAGVKAG